MNAKDAAISIESVVHEAFKEVAQNLYDLYKIEVSDVNITFVNTSVHGSAQRKVRRIDVRSSTEHY